MLYWNLCLLLAVVRAISVCRRLNQEMGQFVYVIVHFLRLRRWHLLYSFLVRWLLSCRNFAVWPNDIKIVLSFFVRFCLLRLCVRDVVETLLFGLMAF